MHEQEQSWQVEHDAHCAHEEHSEHAAHCWQAHWHINVATTLGTESRSKRTQPSLGVNGALIFLNFSISTSGLEGAVSFILHVVKGWMISFSFDKFSAGIVCDIAAVVASVTEVIPAITSFVLFWVLTSFFLFKPFPPFGIFI